MLPSSSAFSVIFYYLFALSLTAVNSNPRFPFLETLVGGKDQKGSGDFLGLYCGKSWSCSISVLNTGSQEAVLGNQTGFES